MKFNNLFTSSFSKLKLVLILLSIILAIGCNGFIIYQAFGSNNTKQDMSVFKESIADIVRVQDKKISSKEKISEINSSNQSNVLFSYDNDDNTNPFRSLLIKKDNDGIRPKIEILGILNGQETKRAIIRLKDSKQGSYIVEDNERIKELKIKKITDKKIIVTKQGLDFSYELGGQNYESKSE
ncbi:hypothetical protein [Sporohalobacter salinus]|uniref:hypothetical protein n=1 Tax=Sporohalobacter salinus TaxID=1494606 RepID=UPI001960D6A8|nr:hypothetical protein [Sporohalobacter salinus]MBM7622741.1 type II secretory pathway component PulC [Sporohalobacter salinus]